MSTMEEILPVQLAFEQYRSHYDNGGADYSVTELIQPPRITLLQKRHWREILAKPLDIRHSYDSFDGTGTHMLFEKMLREQQQTEFILEKRVWDVILERRISGCPDVIHPGSETLYDFKKTSVWKKIFGDTKKWEEQLNIYCALLRKTRPPIPIKRIVVIGWWKDWAEKELKERGKDYPKMKIEAVPIPMWSHDDQEGFLYESVGVLIENEGIPDDRLPLCSKDDTWERDSGWAVMPYKGKKRQKKAARVLPTLEEATAWAESHPPPEGMQWILEERKGTRGRCEEWCDVTDWCNQYQEWKGGK